MVLPGIFFLLGMLLLSVGIQRRRQTTLDSGANQTNSAHITASALARTLLDLAGLSDTEVRRGDDCLGDHYDLAQNAICFDHARYSDVSLTAIAISIHEVGHALHESRQGTYSRLVSSLYQCSSLISALSWVSLVAGILLHSDLLIWTGIGGSLAGMILHVPYANLEAYASKRGMQELVQLGILGSEELEKVEVIVQEVSKGFAGGAVAVLLARLLERPPGGSG